MTYSDIHGDNVLLSGDRTWLIDWAWPTRGAAVITPSCLAVQLIAAKHSPESAEGWVSQLEGWKEATPESIAAFARADVGLYRWQVEARPDQEWVKGCWQLRRRGRSTWGPGRGWGLWSWWCPAPGVA